MKHTDSDIGYQPMVAQSRFGVLGWLYLRDESCYTPEELAFRERLLEARARSGMDSALLETTDSFFATALEDAFIDVHADSLLLASLYRPKHTLTRDAFHLPLTNHRKMRWQTLETLSRRTGDYLLIRNQHLSSEHLNQPMNYLLLDMVRMIRKMAENSDPEYVSTEVQLLEQYIRGMEVHLEGGDRLFLADFRAALEQEVSAEIQQVMRSRFLKLQLEVIRQQVRDIAEDRHALLHFSLSHEPVNSHPYLEYLESPPDIRSLNLREFPTLAASLCARAPDALVSGYTPIAIDAATLRACQTLRLPEKLDPPLVEAFAKALADIHELLRFDGILHQLLHLLEQAGEVLTRLQFREEIDAFLLDVEHFIHHSGEPITLIREANRAVYQRQLLKGRETGLFAALSTGNRAKSSAFLQNQDSLTLSVATRTPMQRAMHQLTQRTHEVRGHLREGATRTEEEALLESTRQTAEQLMENMHHWRAVRHPGLAALPPLALAPEAAPEPSPPPLFIPASAGTSATSAAVMLTPGLLLVIPLAIFTVLLLGFYLQHLLQSARPSVRGGFFQRPPGIAKLNEPPTGTLEAGTEGVEAEAAAGPAPFA